VELQGLEREQELAVVDGELGFEREQELAVDEEEHFWDQAVQGRSNILEASAKEPIKPH
jgi:hypothetical protein